MCNLLPDISWKSKRHYDEENNPMFSGDFIVGINTPEEIATYHIKLQYWDLFDIPELEREPKYDNYDNEEVLKRILSLKKKVIYYKSCFTSSFRGHHWRICSNYSNFDI